MSLEINDLTVELCADKQNDKCINVADSLFLNVDEGEVVSIVGESGSGKSFLGLSILRLNPPRISKIASGEIKIKCKSQDKEIDILKLKPDERRLYRPLKHSFFNQRRRNVQRFGRVKDIDSMDSIRVLE